MCAKISIYVLTAKKKKMRKHDNLLQNQNCHVLVRSLLLSIAFDFILSFYQFFFALFNSFFFYIKKYIAYIYTE